MGSERFLICIQASRSEIQGVTPSNRIAHVSDLKIQISADSAYFDGIVKMIEDWFPAPAHARFFKAQSGTAPGKPLLRYCNYRVEIALGRCYPLLLTEI
jgi:hypothetical protein